MKKAVLTVNEKVVGNNAGPKAKVDESFFLSQNEFEKLDINLNVKSKWQKLLFVTLKLPKILKKLAEYDEILFQYPTYSSFVMKYLIDGIKRIPKVKLFFLVHDVESLRLFKGQPDYWKGERELFNTTDGLIAHNSAMSKWLVDNGVHVPLINLKIFDYRNDFSVSSDSIYQKSICFAGNLNKAPFLSRLILNDSNLYLFGPTKQKNYKNGINYCGSFLPDDLPEHLTQNFGLVWDGSSLEGCDGTFGEYMKYNNPHKVSLYLSCGMPVIIWDKSAMAPFIRSNELGIAVNNLTHLDTKLSKLSQDEYRKMRDNCVKFSSKLRQGYFIKKAITSLEKVTEVEK